MMALPNLCFFPLSLPLCFLFPFPFPFPVVFYHCSKRITVNFLSLHTDLSFPFFSAGLLVVGIPLSGNYQAPIR